MHVSTIICAISNNNKHFLQQQHKLHSSAFQHQTSIHFLISSYSAPTYVMSFFNNSSPPYADTINNRMQINGMQLWLYIIIDSNPYNGQPWSLDV